MVMNWDKNSKRVPLVADSNEKKGFDFNSELEKYISGVSSADMPDYSGFADADGNLLDRYRLKARPQVTMSSNLAGLMDRLSGINADKRGLEAIRTRALATGPSAWADLMLEKSALEQATRADELARSGNAATAKAFSNLASRGGMASGSRERIASKMALANLMGRQELNRAGQSDRLGILTSDENQKLDLLKMLPGAEVTMLEPELRKTNMWSSMADAEAARKLSLDLSNRAYETDVDRANIASLMTDTTNKQKYDLDKWRQQMETYGALMQSKAQEEAGKK